MVTGLKDATYSTSNPELELGVQLPTHKFLIGRKICVQRVEKAYLNE